VQRPTILISRASCLVPNRFRNHESQSINLACAQERVVVNRRRISEATERVTRRWQQADDAPRLLSQVPDLDSLRMQIEELGSGRTADGSKHTRLFVLPSAPALFLVPCGDPRCEDGGHDLTREIMASLRAHREQFDGQDSCGGSVGSRPCACVIRYWITASYRTAQQFSEPQGVVGQR
jgi:hypothetical protein